MKSIIKFGWIMMDNVTITVIIVVYNKEVSDSKTIRKLQTIPYLEVIVVDNSTCNNFNDSFCKNNNIKYISMNGNKGLSKAYNVAIDSITCTDVIVLLDDDTNITEDYFEKLRLAVLKNPDVDVFAPVIRGQDGVIYSPNSYNFFKNKLIKSSTDPIPQKSFNAISSCLAIRKRVFDDYRYNEVLFVDEIDHCFFREQRERNKKFIVLNITINQNFHQREKKIDPKKAWLRVKIRIIDIFRHARLINKIKYLWLAFVKCCGIGFQIGVKSKSLSVILKSFALSFRLLFRSC